MATEIPTTIVEPSTTCAKCGKHYTTEKSYQIHLHRKTPCLPVGEPRWRCSACDRIFESGEAKYSHCRSQKHKRAVQREQAAANGIIEDLSGCEVCDIERFLSESARTCHFKSTKHVTAFRQKEEFQRREAMLAAGEDPEVPGCDICKCKSFSTPRARESHLLTKSHLTAVKRCEKRLSEEVDGCDTCGTERFRSEGVRAAHLLSKGHLDAVERAERRDQRRLGHRVQGRTHKARAAREDRTTILRMEDYAAAGMEGSDRTQFHRVGRAFPKRQVPASISPSSEPISERPQRSSLAFAAPTLEAACPTTTCSHIPCQTVPRTASQLSDQTPEDIIDEPTTTEDASDAVPVVVNSTALTELAPSKRTNTGVSQFDSSARARRNGLGLTSVTDSINTHVSGLYFGVPERTWAMLRPLNPSYSPSLLDVERSEMTVIKFGMKRGDTDRTEQHCTAFQGFYLLDHVPTEYMAEVEDLLKVWLRNEGLLFEGLHENRNSRDTELTVVVTQADYARVVERTLMLIKQTDDKKRRLLGVGELAREEEARAEQERAKAVQEAERRGQEAEKSRQMAEKTTHLAFEIRMAELELVKLGLLPAHALSACQLQAICTLS